MREKYSLGDVFGVSRGIPKTYVERPRVDERFINDLTRYKHIVIHGSSKQGKTSLRKQHLNETDFEVVQCTRNMQKEDIYGALLKSADIGISETKTTKHTKGVKIKVTFSGEGNIPLIAKVKGDGEISNDRGSSDAMATTSFDIDISNPNDIYNVLHKSGFKKYIVLEDFHYLPNEVQEAISYDLKAFHDNSPYIFIIVGVWLESNKLILFNGDLSGRINTISADNWTKEELKKILREGEKLLNIRFSQEAEEELLSCCYRNVGLLQEILYRLCEEYNIWSTRDNVCLVGTGQEVRAVLSFISKEEAPRYINFIKAFCDETKNSQMKISKWVMKFLMSAKRERLSKAICTDDVLDYIKKHHPYGFRITKSSLTQFFSRIDKIQSKHKIQPLILEYSQGFIRIMDVNFIVFLTTHYKQELAGMVGE